jgi:hypothetical protein
MTRKLYDKLVRDRIPEIIREGGSTCGAEMYNDEAGFAARSATSSSKKRGKRRMPVKRTWPLSWLTCRRSSRT